MPTSAATRTRKPPNLRQRPQQSRRRELSVSESVELAVNLSLVAGYRDCLRAYPHYRSLGQATRRHCHQPLKRKVLISYDNEPLPPGSCQIGRLSIRRSWVQK